MRITVSWVAISSAVLLSGCQSPLLRDGFFKKKDEVAATKPAAEATSPMVAKTTPPQSPTPLTPTNPQRPVTPPATRPAQSPIQQVSATVPANSQRPTGASNERMQLDFERGENAMRTKRYTEAKMAFESVLSVDPQNFAAHHRLAQVSDMQQRWSDAERHYLSALSLRPDDPNVLCDLGYSYTLQGRFDESIEKLTRAAQIDPNHRTVMLNMGAAYAGMGETNRALFYFRKVLPDDKANELLSNELQRSIQRQKNYVKNQGAPNVNLQGMTPQDLTREMARIHEESNVARERLEYLQGQLDQFDGYRRNEATRQLQQEFNQPQNVQQWRSRINGIPEDKANARMVNPARGGSPFDQGQSANPAWNGGYDYGQANGFNANNGSTNDGFRGSSQPGFQENPNVAFPSSPQMATGQSSPSMSGQNNGWNGSGNSFAGSGLPNSNSFDGFANSTVPNGPGSFNGGFNNQPPQWSGNGQSGFRAPSNNFANSGSNFGPSNSGNGAPTNGFNMPGNNSMMMPNPNLQAGGSGFNAPMLGSNGLPLDGFNGSGAAGINSFPNSMNNLPNSNGPLVQNNPGPWTPGSRSGFNNSGMPQLPSGGSLPSPIQQSGGPFNGAGDPGVKQLTEAMQMGMGAGPGSLFNFSDPNRFDAQRMSGSGLPALPSTGTQPSNGMPANGLPIGTPMMGTPPLSNSMPPTNVDPNRFRQMPTWGGAPSPTSR